MTRPNSLLFFSLLLCLISTSTFVWAQQCSSSSQCPSTAPCCSEYGYCGTGSSFCLGGCDPMGSFAKNSCSPMPKCKSQTVSFVNNAKPYVASSTYRGDPSVAPFTLDEGAVTPGKTGLKLLLTKTGTAAKGTRLSSTRYWYYGVASVVMKHNSWNGVVNTFIGMSSTKDEIDWEFTTNSTKDVETNYYWFGQAEGYTHGFTPSGATLNAISPNFSVNDWHTYTIDWDANRLKWIIDGTTVRTIYRKNTYNAKDGLYHYPSSPMRLQMSIWGAGDGTFPQGTVDWSGGLIDWNKATNGQFYNLIKSFTISCSDPADVNDSRPNYQFSIKLTNSQNGQPQVLSTSKSSILA